MPIILDFKNGNVPAFQRRSGLRLMLWAGDGLHEGVSDIKRLPNYDVYVCLGLGHLRENVDDMSERQILCIINVHEEGQMNAFYQLFENTFALVDGDYFGNTPKLNMRVYERLLCSGGRAYHTEGLNGLEMVDDGILSTLEVLAPVLTSHLINWRRYSKSIMSLSQRDTLTPGEVLSSPDMKHPFYAYAVEEQKKFERWQKERNPAWPSYKSSLEEHWDSLPITTIVASFNLRHVEHFKGLDSHSLENLIHIHLPAFDAFLRGKIYQSESRVTVHQENFDTKCSIGDQKAQVKTLQFILEKVNTWLPSNLRGTLQYFQDSRKDTHEMEYGLVIEKD